MSEAKLNINEWVNNHAITKAFNSTIPDTEKDASYHAISNQMDLLELLDAAEKEFNVMLPAEIIDSVNTPNKLITALENALS